MNIRSCTLALFTTVLLGTSALLGGCATTGMDRSVRTSNSMQDVETEINKMMAQSDVTAASLDTLAKAGQPDLKKSFDKYSNNLAKLDKEGKRLLKRIEEMKTHSKEYFSEWEKQGDEYKNQEIRALSEERRTELAAIYGRVHTAGAGIKAAYLAYLTDLKEIETYMSNDLTPKGVEAINPVVNKTFQDQEVLKESLRPVQSAIAEIKAELYKKK